MGERRRLASHAGGSAVTSMHPMHPVHQEFVCRPAFCRLEDLFFLLDAMDAHERHLTLAYVYPDVFQTEKIRCPPEVTTTAQGELWSYARFKAWCQGLAEQSSAPFAVYAVVGAVLAWLCRNSDEALIPGLAAANEADLRRARRDVRAGAMSAERLEALEERWREQSARLEDDRRLVQARYAWFCEHVVDRLPRDDTR
jgi:hypothetical protein